VRSLIFLALFLPISVSAQSSSRGRNGAGARSPLTSGIGSPPQLIVAPDVPMLDSLPQAIRVGWTVYVSAMVPLDSAGRLVGGTDLGAQTRQALANLASVMRSAHGVAGDVIRLTVYVRDLTPDKVATVRQAVLAGLDRTAPPALTIVGVNALADPAMLVTLDATGQLRSEYPDRTRH
jgi:enamine deaminase RidA (YjgF/YER057c/UK114 family)